MKSWRFLIGLVISAVFLYLAFRRTDLAGTWASLREINAWYLIPAVLVLLLGYLCRIVRWKYLLRTTKEDTSFGNLASALFIGFMANNVLPLRAGELIRAYFVGRKESISKSSSFASIVVERVFDGFAMLLFLGLVLMVRPFPLWPRRVGILSGIILLCALILLFGLMHWEHIFTGLIRRLSRPLSVRLRSRILRTLGNFIAGLGSLRSFRDVCVVFLLSILAWSFEAAVYFFVGLAFGFNIALGFLLLVATVNLGIMIPSSPGYVGTFEFFCLETLLLFSIPRSLGASYALTLHAVVYVPITLIGLIYFGKENMMLRTVRRDAVR
jgi:uncharacterized protein (TIRG00374 family)